MKPIDYILVLAILWFPPSGALSQQTPDDNFVILSDMTLLRDASVESFDVDGMRIRGAGADDKLWLWSEIHSATVDADQQTRFNRYLKEIGLPLLRIQHRMAARDNGGLEPFVKQLRVHLNQREGDATYLMHAADLQSRIHSGSRAAATRPLLELLSLRAARPELSKWDDVTGLTFDEETGICYQLIPFWFDHRSLDRYAEDAASWMERNPEKVTAATHLYTAMMLACLGDETCNGYSQQAIESKAGLKTWQHVVDATLACASDEYSRALAVVDGASFEIPSLEHATALYLDGYARMKMVDEVTGSAIHFLQIPASYGTQFPELSSAAIFHVITEDLASGESYASLESEMTQLYAGTYFGKRFAETKNRKSDR